MSGERKLWSAQEDKILLELKEQGIKKWSTIAKAMQTQYNITRRTGKQCRQRWFNKLNPKIDRGEWSYDQTLKLFQQHDKLGNSWVKINQQSFKGRTDNNIKNHFYSVLRKSIRRLNKYLSNLYLPGSTIERKIDSQIVSKIVNTADDKFDKKLFLPNSIIEKAHQLKNKLVPFSESDKSKWGKQQQIIQFYNEIIKFQKEYQNSQSELKDLPQQINDKKIKQQAQQPVVENKLFKIHENNSIKNDNKEQAHVLPKVPSNSLFHGISNYCKSSSGSSQMMFLKKVSNNSGLSYLFPLSSSQSWQKDALKLSLNNLHGQNAQMNEVSQFLFERLNNK